MIMLPYVSAVAFCLTIASAAQADICPAGTVAIVKGNTVHCITIERKQEEELKGHPPGRKTTTAKLFEANSAPYETMRYPTVGDWIVPKKGNGSIHVSVARLPDPRYEFLVAIHELVEARLCQERGITQAAVDDWDMHHQDADEPGAVEGAPYFAEHMFATKIEHLMSRALGVDWDEYEAAIEELGK